MRILLFSSTFSVVLAMAVAVRSSLVRRSYVGMSHSPVPAFKLQGKSPEKALEEYRLIYEASISNPKEFWLNQAKKSLHWFRPPTDGTPVTSGSLATGDVSWFNGAQLNAAWNCLDRYFTACTEIYFLIMHLNMKTILSGI